MPAWLLKKKPERWPGQTHGFHTHSTGPERSMPIFFTSRLSLTKPLTAQGNAPGFHLGRAPEISCPICLLAAKPRPPKGRERGRTGFLHVSRGLARWRRWPVLPHLLHWGHNPPTIPCRPEKPNRPSMQTRTQANRPGSTPTRKRPGQIRFLFALIPVALPSRHTKKERKLARIRLSFFGILEAGGGREYWDAACRPPFETRPPNNSARGITAQHRFPKDLIRLGNP